MSSSEWAAWVQAFGATVAVFAGAVGIWWQNHQMKKLTRTRNVEKIRAVAMIVRIAADAVEQWLDLWQGDEPPSLDAAQHCWVTFQLATEEMKKLGMEQVLYAAIVGNLIQSKECARQISEAVGSAYASIPSDEIVSNLRVNIHDLYYYEECMHSEARRIGDGQPATNTDDA